ncbi:GGDEF domain-containing protein [Mangrovitalea sediminis]|uniref:GGDEF domain-containing protein n=1 Tax=Mangrovitalea sediminis TaxID=1982043 RepID=UPI0013041877
MGAGQDVGDRFLIEIAQALTSGLRQGDFVARVGGDEFVVVGQCVADNSEACCEVFGQRLSTLTRKRYDIGATILDYQGPSIGVVTSASGKVDSSSLMAEADAKMYAVKRERKSAKSN